MLKYGKVRLFSLLEVYCKHCQALPCGLILVANLFLRMISYINPKTTTAPRRTRHRNKVCVYIFVVGSNILASSSCASILSIFKKKSRFNNSQYSQTVMFANKVFLLLVERLLIAASGLLFYSVYTKFQMYVDKASNLM